MAQYVEIEFVGRDEVSGVASRVKQSIASVETGATRLGNVLHSVLSGAVGGLTFALTNLVTQALGNVVNAVASSVNSYADFEAAQLRLQAVSGATNEQLARMSDLAVELGKNTRFSASESLQAMIALAQGGVTIEQILGGATQAVLDLAAAGGVNLTVAADLVAKQLAVWGDTGLDAARAATLIAAAANASTTDVQEMGYGFAAVGAVAKGMGLDFEETAIALAAITPAASSAQDAGTSFKVMLQRLASPTKEARKVMEQLGITVFDAQGNFVGLESLAEQLQNALSGLTEEQRAAVAEILGGADAARAILQLAGLGGEGIQKLRADMQQLGPVSEQAAKMNQGLGFAIDELKAKFETLGLAIGERLAPVLMEIIGIAGDVIEAFTKLIEGISPKGVTDAVNTLKSGFQSAKTSILNALASISRHIQVVLQDLRPLGESINKALQIGFESLRSFASQVADVWRQVVAFIARTLNDIAKWFGSILPEEVKKGASEAGKWLQQNVINPVSKYAESVQKRATALAAQQAKDEWLKSKAAESFRDSATKGKNEAERTAEATRKIALNLDDAKKKTRDWLDSVDPLNTRFGRVVQQLQSIADPARGAQGLAGALQSTIDRLRQGLFGSQVRERFRDVVQMFETREERERRSQTSAEEIARQERRAMLDVVLELASSALAALQGRTDAAAQFAFERIMSLPKMIAEGFGTEQLLNVLELVRQDLIATFSTEVALEAKREAAAAKMEQGASRFEAAVARFEQVVQSASFWTQQTQPVIADLRLLKQAR